MAARVPSSAQRRASSSPQDESEKIGDFRKMEQIGKGSFALVYRGIHMKKRTLVAIKSVQLYKLNKKLKDNLVSEIEILKSLHHPHIVSLIQCLERDQMMHLVMEFCELGDLSQFIKKRAAMAEEPLTGNMFQKYPSPAHGGLHEVIARHFLKQIASALEFMRAKNYVHRDIKPQNLLLNPSPHYYSKHRPSTMPYQVAENSLVPATGIESLPMLKVADFGFARVLPQTSLAETLCGSPLYMAPEILRYEKYDAKADLWSVGTVLHEMLFAKPPFRANNHVELLRKIEKQEDKIRFPESVPISRDMRHIIRALLKRSPLERVGFENFFDNPVIKDPIPGLVGEDRPPEPRVESKRPSAKPLPQGVDTEQEMSPIQSPQLGSTPPTRSPRPSVESAARTTVPRRLSNAQPSSPIDRRPPISSAATAPARPGQLQERTQSLGQAERRPGRVVATPPTSMLREQITSNKGSDESALREAREKAAQDVAFERDYVLIEKRAVEVNAFADELANKTQSQSNRDPVTSPKSAAMVRRASTQATPSVQQTSKALQTTSRQRPDSLHQRTGSYERRYGTSPSSATSVITKALKGANLRVFGVSVSPPGVKGISPPQAYNAFPTYPTAQGSLVFVGDKALDTKDGDWRAVFICEELATRSDVVFGFAEVKYQQLLPTPPSQDQGLGIAQGGAGDDEEDEDLTVDAVVTISEEALVLYVKSLAILAKTIDLAGSWWGQKHREPSDDVSAVSTKSPQSRATLASAGSRMNNVVQWCRTRFNDCLEKSEFVGRKLLESQRNLPLDHPGHPSNHPDPASSAASANSVGTSAENINLTSGVTAEKLMYERALELSRAAAVKELVNEDLPGCEIGYRTAIRMLEAILENDEELHAFPKRAPKGTKETKEDAPINGLESEDRQTVMKLVETMRNRLKALRKKMDTPKATKRQSLPGTQQPSYSKRESPLGTPLASNTPPK